MPTAPATRKSIVLFFNIIGPSLYFKSFIACVSFSPLFWIVTMVSEMFSFENDAFEELAQIDI